MPPEEFVRGCDRRCCDSALNQSRPRRLLIRPQRDTATPGPARFSEWTQRPTDRWASIHQLIQTQSRPETVLFIGGFVLKMEAWGTKISATQITTGATHISSRLSTLAHSWVTNSQGILLTCLFNFTEPHNSCCHHTCVYRTSQSSKACEPGCAFPLCRSDVSCHLSCQWLNSSGTSFCWQSQAWEAIYLILLQLKRMWSFTFVLQPTFATQSDIGGSQGELSRAKCHVIYDSG